MGFMDKNFAREKGLRIRTLDKPKPLYLAHGDLSDWITTYVEQSVRIGHHREHIMFFLTTLSSNHPVILGLPWLQKHNPDIDWKVPSLTFREQCVGDCIPRGLPTRLRCAPRALEAPELATGTTGYRAPTVEEIPDEGEPNEDDEEEEEDMSVEGRNKARRLQRAVKAQDKKTRKQRERRQRESLARSRERAMENGFRWTLSKPDQRAVMIPNVPDQVKLPARKIQGSRVFSRARYEPVNRQLAEMKAGMGSTTILRSSS
ncbi:hypothetical protein V8F06_013445 [Rhypophila decipiens]